MVGGVTLLSHAALADTVYRCGETYSTSSQCANGTVSEVKPSSVLHATGQDKDNGSTATRDMRDAQALEKQRLQAERQAAQAAPIRLSTPIAPPPSSATHSEPLSHKGKDQGNTPVNPTAPTSRQ